MPSPEGIEAGLAGAGAHLRGSEFKGKPAQKPMGVFRTTLLLLVMIAIILGVVIIAYGLF
jgi:hypothetical protein